MSDITDTSFEALARQLSSGDITIEQILQLPCSQVSLIERQGLLFHASSITINNAEVTNNLTKSDIEDDVTLGGEDRVHSAEVVKTLNDKIVDLQEDSVSVDALKGSSFSQFNPISLAEDYGDDRNSRRYVSFPGACHHVGTGRMWVAYRRGLTHLGAGGGFLKYSNDGGKTYSKEITIFDVDGKDVRDFGMSIVTVTGATRPCVTYTRRTGDGAAPDHTAHYVIINDDDDDNITLTETEFPQNIARDFGVVTCPIVEDPSDGSWNVVIYGYELDPSSFQQVFYRSTDEGATWAQTLLTDGTDEGQILIDEDGTYWISQRAGSSRTLMKTIDRGTSFEVVTMAGWDSDEIDFGTQCRPNTVKHNGLYYWLYRAGDNRALGMAVSSDMIQWNKFKIFDNFDLQDPDSTLPILFMYAQFVVIGYKLYLAACFQKSDTAASLYFLSDESLSLAHNDQTAIWNGNSEQIEYVNYALFGNKSTASFVNVDYSNTQLIKDLSTNAFQVNTYAQPTFINDSDGHYAQLAATSGYRGNIGIYKNCGFLHQPDEEWVMSYTIRLKDISDSFNISTAYVEGTSTFISGIRLWCFVDGSGLIRSRLYLNNNGTLTNYNAEITGALLTEFNTVVIRRKGDLIEWFFNGVLVRTWDTTGYVFDAGEATNSTLSLGGVTWSSSVASVDPEFKSFALYKGSFNDAFCINLSEL